jgi:UPF0755 protein
MRRALSGGLAALVLAGLLLAASWTAKQRYLGPGPLTVATDIVVPAGSAAHVAEALHAAGAIADPRAFRLAAWWTRAEGTLRAGEFAFPPHVALREILAILRTAHPVQHHLTIPEGLTAAQIAELLDRTDTLSGPTPRPQEGTVLPQTYAFERGTPREAVLARAIRAMDRAIADIWGGRAEGLKLANAQELLILASIVERETARAEERPLVAAVYLNRLHRNMRLQADPTASYAASGGQSLDRPPTRVDLDSPNPYNTYRYVGLPPGPIDSPGLASLQATAHPAASEALYFVADGKGGHVFATTMDEHNRNVARWRAANALKESPR